MATTFWKEVLSQFWIFLSLIKKCSNKVIFTLLDHFFFCVYFLIWSLLDQFWCFLNVWKNQEIQDCGSKISTVWKHDVILTSYDVISCCWRPQRKHLWTYYLFCCHSLDTPPTSLSQKTTRITMFNNYSPKLRCIMVDICRESKRRGKHLQYLPLFTHTELNNCLTIYQTSE